jgi:dipeptidase E
MRQIFLTSNIAPVIQKIIPMLPNKPENLSLVFIPTAAYGEAIDKDISWTSEDKIVLQNSGFKVTELNISDYNKETLKTELEKFDIIFVEGGNTFYLLQEALKSGFDQILPDLLDSGKIYIGASAGSVLLAPSLDPIKRFDDPSFAPELTSFTGLGLINFIPFVHFGASQYRETYLQSLEDFYDKDVVGIIYSDNQCIYVKDDVYKIIT